jgi:hypothetical protein
MTENPVIYCQTCAAVMFRKPQAVAVNWGGLPPHLEGTRSPAIQSMIANEQQNREEFQAASDNNPFNEFHK